MYIRAHVGPDEPSFEAISRACALATRLECEVAIEIMGNDVTQPETIGGTPPLGSRV